MSRRSSPSVTMSQPSVLLQAQQIAPPPRRRCGRVPRGRSGRGDSARIASATPRRPRPAADGRDGKERQRSRRGWRRRTAPARPRPSAGRSPSSGPAARPSGLRGPSSRGARDCRSAWRRARRATPSRPPGRASWRTVKTQWSKRSVSPTIANSFGVDRAVLDPAVPVQVEHRAGRGVALRRGRPSASRSPPTWSPCLPTRTSNRRTVTSRSGAEPVAAQAAERDQRGLRRVDRAGGDRAALQVRERLHRTVAPRHDVARRDRDRCRAWRWRGSRCRIAAARRPTRAASSRRCRSRPTAAPSFCILVGGVERDVDRRALRVEEVADDFPDHRDLGVVHHRPDLQRARHQNTSRPHRARPMNS